MVMSKKHVLELAHEVLVPSFRLEKNTLDRVDRWYRWDPEDIVLPDDATLEHKELRKLASTPWLKLVVITVSQQLVMELVRSSRTDDVDQIWGPWQRNRMHSRQRAIHRAAGVYGYAYSLVLPGDTGAVIRGYSPRQLHAHYHDPVVDEYPAYFMIDSGDGLLRIFDEEHEYRLVRNDQRKYEYVEHLAHGVGVPPVVRYSNEIDLEGRTDGEVEPYIDVAKRVNKTTYDRLLTQHHNSWKIITATGLEAFDSEEEARRAKLKLRQDTILTGEGEVSFGQLDATPLDGFIHAQKSDIGALAAVSQTPAHTLTGDMINLSADAITEARSTLDLKAGERKIGYGDSHCQTLRLAAHVEGREDDAADFTLVGNWADLESRAMSQAADALGKMATMLDIPAEKLWDRIPGVTAEEAQGWLKYRDKNPTAESILSSALRRQTDGADFTG